uniref:Ubiquitin-like protease family profile domain-containing protein n=1 Tax=Brassica oleracea var. oleracea TaxID=109376 RepID=A0A0D3AM37_BRAOL
MAAFWEMMGVDVDVGPITEHIKAAFGRCEEWSREDRMRLRYLAIFTGIIEGRKYSTATRASLARLVWAYFALPKFGANYGHPLPNRPSPLMLAYNGGKGRRFFKEAISRHTSVINFVQKDFAEMFPRWDFDVEDPTAENIIKVMFNAKANWNWTMNCWEVTGTKPRVKKEESEAETESGVKEESAVSRKKARKAASVEASKVPSAEARAEARSNKVSTEIKLLGDMIEAVEKKVGITKKGTASNELQMTTSNLEKCGHETGSESVNGAKAGQNGAHEPQEPSGEPSDKEISTDSDLQKGETRRQRKRNAAMAHVVEGRNITAKVIIPNKRVGQGYDPFAPYDKKRSKVLTDWVILDPYFKTPMDKKPRRCPSRFYFTLRTPHMDSFINVLRQRYRDNPHHFRSERLCFLDHIFSRQWSHKYPEFKSDKGDINGLGRRLPGGAWNYHAGMVPTFCQSMKVWGLDVDDIYAPVNFRNEHWIAIWISIPKRHIIVWDSILTHIKAADLDVPMEPFVNMVPYLLVECAGSDEERVNHTLELYTYERVTVGVAQCRAGDCGLWALKYIECHALGMSFPP